MTAFGSADDWSLLDADQDMALDFTVWTIGLLPKGHRDKFQRWPGLPFEFYLLCCGEYSCGWMLDEC
jgi:hypothetical protein